MAALYPTDLTDAQWEAVAPVFMKAAGSNARPPKLPMRRVVEAVLYVVGAADSPLPSTDAA